MAADDAAERRLVGPRRRRKIGRICAARYVNISVGVDRDPEAIAAAEIGGIDEGRTGGIELREESVCPVDAAAAAAAEMRLEGIGSRREGDPTRYACDVGVAGRVHGDPFTPVTAIAAEVGGIDEG